MTEMEIVNGEPVQRTLSRTASEYVHMNAVPHDQLGDLDFGINSEELQFLVDLNKRSDKNQVVTLAKAGGVRGIAHNLRTDLTDGRASDEPRELTHSRREKFGINKVPIPPPIPLWKLVWVQFEDRVLQILLAGAMINIVVGAILKPEDGWLEGVAILVAVTIVVGITAGNDYMKERQFRKANEQQADRTVKVVRSGERITESTYKLLVGDVVELGNGDQVPTDGLLISAITGVFVVDESSLTGESDPIKKGLSEPFLFSGTEVTNGKGTYLVTAVGEHTAGGNIVSLISGTKNLDVEKDVPELPVIVPTWTKENVQHWLAINECEDIGQKFKRHDGPKVATLKRQDFVDMLQDDPEAGVILRKDLELRMKESKAAEKAGDEDEGGEDSKTNLERKLERTAILIGYGGFGAGALTFVALSIRWIISYHNAFQAERLVDFVHFFIIGVTIVVVAVPEGLPLAVTIALAYGMSKMRDDNNYVKVLSASETMGSATAICSDKTGTLTQNIMKIVDSSVDGLNMCVPGERNQLSKSTSDLLVESFCANSTCFLQPDPENPGIPKQFGSKTEIPLIVISQDAFGQDYKEVRKNTEIDAQYAFNSTRKRMSTVVKNKDGTFNVHVKGASEIVLDLCTQRLRRDGSVTHFRSADKTALEDQIEEFARRGLRTLVVAYKQLQERPDPAALRRIALKDSAPVEKPVETPLSPTGLLDNTDSDSGFLTTTPDVTNASDNKDRSYSDESDVRRVDDDNIDAMIEDEGCADPDAEAVALETDLVFLCMLGIEDPVRDEVPSAVQKCKQAGIVVRMVTGDNPLTAESIAKQCGIIERGHTVMTGEQFRALPLLKKKQCLPKLRVLARSSPEDKLVLVGLLREMGEIVAVTGDGTNDGPALKKANVGFAMGIQGTDIAKNAADIILLDDNFNSIVMAIKWGRSIYDSIRKFLQFQLAVNIVAIIITLTGALALGNEPLSAVQLLWVNLIMDTLGALALATEPPHEDVLTRPPNHPDDDVVNRGMIVFIATQTVYQLTALHVVMFAPHKFFNIRPYDFSIAYADISNAELSDNQRILTLLFTTFIIMQVFNETLARHLDHPLFPFKRIHKSPLFIAILITIVVVQILVVTYGGDFTSTVALSAEDWAICAAFAVIVFPFDFIVRLFVHQKQIWAWVNAPYDPVTGGHPVKRSRDDFLV